MTEKAKNIVVTIVFVFIITTLFIINILKKDTDISIAERRNLEHFPEFSISKLFDGSFFEKFDKYSMDQFIRRDEFRKLKVGVEFNILKKQNYNNIYKYDDYLIEQTYELNEKSVTNVANKINQIKDLYLNSNNNIYYTIVPDKNYFVNKDNLKIDYSKLEDIMKQNLSNIQYIKIFDLLELSDYYKTDTHWKQENLPKIANEIASKMNINVNTQYKKIKVTDFKGVYASQVPIKTQNEPMYILTNKTLENCKVYNYESKKQTTVYDMEKKNSLDKYDIYLSGATPLLKIENPQNNNKKELIVFRDSYGSSLIPLLVEAYSKITVVDTRYVSPKILGEYIDFPNKDVLFIYSTLIINNSISLK